MLSKRKNAKLMANSKINNEVNYKKYLPQLKDEYNEKQYNEIRKLEICLIIDCFSNYDWNFEFKEKLARRIERSCYNATCDKADEINIDKNWAHPKFEKLYHHISSRVTNNLDSSSEVNNPYLMTKIIEFLKGDPQGIDPSKVGTMSSELLCPASSLAIRNDLLARSQQKIVNKTSSMYKCRKCGKSETITKEIQIRALDEGASVSISCTFCQFHWVIG